MNEVINLNAYKINRHRHASAEQSQALAVNESPTYATASYKPGESYAEAVTSVYEDGDKSADDIIAAAYEQLGDLLPEDEIKQIAIDSINNTVLKDPRRNHRLWQHPEDRSKY